MAKFVGLILAQSKSRRLPGKNVRDFRGKPMFLVNTEKCLKIFDRVYVSSDNQAILNMAEKAGAIPIWRSGKLCGSVPNIPVYQHALTKMGEVDGIVAVQANSPNIDPLIIRTVKELAEMGYEEVMTVHEDRSIYGSVWAIATEKLKNYGDPYKPNPSSTVVDPSIDIHTEEDYNLALRCQ